MIAEAIEKLISELRRTRSTIEDAEAQLAAARTSYDVMQEQFSKLIGDIRKKIFDEDKKK